MAEFTGISQLTGFTYEIYDKLVNLIPDSAKAIKMIGYKAAEKELGNKFHQNVIVSEEAGFTHAAPGAGAFAVNAAVSLTTQDAQVEGYQLVLQSSLDYEAAARASSSRKAYAAIAETKLKNMVESTRRRLEAEVWYGQAGLGVLSSTTNVDTTHTKIVFTAASFAPMVWGGKRNFEIVAYTAAGSRLNAADTAGYTIQTVDIANRTVTVLASTTDITALDGAAAGAIFYWKSAVNSSTVAYAGMKGISLIAGNVGSLFNIDAAVYDLWAGNAFAVGSVALTFKKIIQALAAGANRGLDEDVTLWVHPQAWSDLAGDLAGLRRYGGEVETAKQGFKTIRFAHMTGDVTVIGHGMVKEGEGYMLPMKRFSRIGAQDVSFKTPGRNPGDDIFWHDPAKAGFSYRLYTNQAVFCDQPCKCVKLTGIVNG